MGVEMVKLKLEALVFGSAEGPVLEGVCLTHDEFSISVGEGKGWLVFRRVNQCQASYQLLKLLLPHDPNPYPKVSLQRVLWTRQAALEAHQCISAYQAGAGLIP